MKSYFNTNKERGEILEASNRKANSQEQIILNFYKRLNLENDKLCGFPSLKWKIGRTYMYLTPEDIRAICFYNSTPLTSIRRAMTNLANQGMLKKTNIMRVGKYGKAIHTWRLAETDKQKQMEMF